MHKIRTLAAVCLLIVMAGCAAGEARTPGQRLYAAQAMFNTNLRIAAAYVAQPDCSAELPVACGDPRIKARIRVLAAGAVKSLDRARATFGTRQEAFEVAAAARAVRAFVRYLVIKEITRGA